MSYNRWVHDKATSGAVPKTLTFRSVPKRRKDGTFALGCAFPGADRLESLFIEKLEELQPNPDCAALFREVALDEWREQQKAVRTAVKELETKVVTLRRRLQVVESAFLFEKTIDDARIDDLDVEAAIRFGEYALTNAARLWRAAESSQKAQLQRVLFPAGVPFDGKAFGTALTSSAFSYLEEFQSQKSKMVDQTGIEPVTS